MASPKQASYLFDLAIAFADEATKLGFEHSRYDKPFDIESTMPGREATRLISALCEYAENWSDMAARPLSRQTVAAELAYQYALAHNLSSIGRRHYDAITNVARQIGFQGDFKPLVFSKNQDGQRIPLSNAEAEDAFRKMLSAVKEHVNKRLRNQEREQLGEEQQQDFQQDEQEFHDEEEQDEQQNNEQKEPEIGWQAQEFWTRFVQLREYTETRDIGGHQIDTLERRPYLAGAKMIVEGIPNDAIFWAMCMHWPEEVRREQGIVEYFPANFHPERRIDGLPLEFPYLDALYRQRVNPWLISAAGVGKTTVVRKFAEHYEQPHVAIPLNRGTSPSAFNGRPKLSNTSLMIRFLKAMGEQNEEKMVAIAKEAKDEGDVSVSEFTKVFRYGGHILLDELDAGDENLLMMVNMPLANGQFANTAEGKTYPIHPDTLIWAASNTMGLGVTAGQGREYRGRNALDFATIDRFRMGRVKMKGDIEQYRQDFEALILAYR